MLPLLVVMVLLLLLVMLVVLVGLFRHLRSTAEMTATMARPLSWEGAALLSEPSQLPRAPPTENTP